MRVAFAVFCAMLASVFGAMFTLHLPDDLKRAGIALAVLLVAVIVWISIRYYVLIRRLYDDH
ncbi:MAG: hypothetical protein ACREM1_21870 [Longimicrobiales bacterium]